jgi:hypothetical protein
MPQGVGSGKAREKANSAVFSAKRNGDYFPSCATTLAHKVSISAYSAGSDGF